MRGSLLRLLNLPGAFEEELVRLGRLDEGDAVERNLARGKYLRMGADSLAWPRLRSSRPKVDGRTSFHFRHTSVAKPGAHPGAVPTGPTRDGRMYVYPGRGETDLARAAGARYDRRAGAWWVVTGSPPARALEAMASAPARAAWERRRLSGGRSQRGTPAEFQRYVERARLAPENRGEIETDEAGTVSFGSIGDSEAERARFWEEVADRERRDGRVQCRIIAELPHEVSPEGRRRIVEEFVAAFAGRGLPYHAAVHRPDPAKGMDPRNVHLHVVYHDRPAERVGRNRWELAEAKDREARGPAWVRALRQRLADACNREFEREDAVRAARNQAPVGRRLDPRSYREMGVEKLPGRHLGPVGAAFDRSGRPTIASAMNAVAETAWEWAERGRALAAPAARLLTLQARAGALPAAGSERGGVGPDRVRGAALQAALDAARQAILAAAPRDPERGARAAQRVAWARDEGRRLDARIRRHEAAVAGDGGRRGAVTGSRLEEMRQRRRRVAEIEAEAAALVGGGVQEAQPPVAEALAAIARTLGAAEALVESAERASVPRPGGVER